MNLIVTDVLSLRDHIAQVNAILKTKSVGHVKK